MEMSKIDVFNDFIKKRLIDVVISLLFIVYIASQIAQITESGQSIWEIFAHAGLFLAFAVVLKLLMERKGILMGYDDEKFILTVNAYGEQLEKIKPYLEYLGDYCEKKNAQNKKEAVTGILLDFAITYKQYEEYIALPKEDQTNEDYNNALKQIGKVKLHKITPKELTSEGTKVGGEVGSLGKTITEYTKEKSLLDIGVLLISTAVFSWFAVELIQDFTWGTFVWACLQGVFLLSKGVSSMINSYIFVTTEYRNRYIVKKNHLTEFENLYKESNYGEGY